MILISTIVFLFATAVQLSYILLFRFRKRFSTTGGESPSIVSVIICAKNEARHLEQFLPAVLQQEYEAEWEVIVVNDGSTDETGNVLAALQQTYDHLKIVTIDPGTIKDIPGKKYALAQGIAAAKFDRLLLTDADCRPASAQWLHNMANHDKDIVLGYGAYETLPGLLNRFIRWETAHTCMQYASYAAMGMPYMGVGRNLCYRKSLLVGLEKDEDFRKIYGSTPSGDDDLLISKIACKGNTVVCLAPGAHTISTAQRTWKAWWRQKTRHASTGKYYVSRTKAMLGLYGLSHSLYWFLGIALVIYASLHADLPWRHLLLTAFLLRLFLYWLNAANWYRHLNEKKISLFYPLGDLGWALYNVFLSPYILWKNKQAWK